MNDGAPSLLFVGEERSGLAIRRGVTWKDEALAAVPLFAALRSAGINPAACRFTNLFERGGVTAIRRARRDGFAIVGMGKRVQSELRRRHIPHVPIVHPAARGKIRKRESYIAHVTSALASTVRTTTGGAAV